MLLCCLRCALKPSTSTISISKLYQQFQVFRRNASSGSAISPAAYRILCSWLRVSPIQCLTHLVRHVSRHYSAIGPRLDTGGWLTLPQVLLSAYSRQGLSPCKIHRAFLDAITPAPPDSHRGRNDRRVVRPAWSLTSW